MSTSAPKRLASFSIQNPFTRRDFKIFHLKEDRIVPHALQGMRRWDFKYLQSLYEYAKEFTGKDLFVDIGANIGTESILASETFSLCACFEAVEANFDILRRNLFVNRVANISTLKAVDVISGAILEIENPPAMNSGSGRIKVAGSKDSSTTQRVRSIRVDEALENLPPAFIHIDTEGFDLKCLESCTRLISIDEHPDPSRSRPFIRIEFNPTLLEEQGSRVDFLWYFLLKYKYEIKLQTSGGHLAPIPVEAVKILSDAWLEHPRDPWLDLLLIPVEAKSLDLL